jgi:hypothetical protein
MVTVALGTTAPLGSFTVPRSEVVADWPKAKLQVEKMQRSIIPNGNRFTSIPPKILVLRVARKRRHRRAGGLRMVPVGFVDEPHPLDISSILQEIHFHFNRFPH